MKYGLADPTQLGETKLPDGRRLEWARWGPEDGGSLLWTHAEAILAAPVSAPRR